jgi:hypothetical protein
MEGLVKNPQKLTLKDLMDEKKFPRMEKMVTIQCSGTRRVEQIGLYAGEGDEMVSCSFDIVFSRISVHFCHYNFSCDIAPALLY